MFTSAGAGGPTPPRQATSFWVYIFIAAAVLAFLVIFFRQFFQPEYDYDACIRLGLSQGNCEINQLF